MEKRASNNGSCRRLPEWLKRPAPKGEQYKRVARVLGDLQLATVCASASCPNQGECYSAGTATFMIMGAVCTRNCRFCGVRHGDTSPLSSDEPQRLAEAVKKLQLRHVVITSVTRDDLADGGAQHFAAVIKAVRAETPAVTIEVLTPDFSGTREHVNTVCQARPNVFNHNIETTRRLTPQIRSGADYDRSLAVLNQAAQHENHPTVKSGFMLGLGETDDEITQALRDLRQNGVEMLTIGQYLRPGKENLEVCKYYRPEEFKQIEKQAKQMGFAHAAAGPSVRSSYHAEASLKDVDG